MLVPLGEPWGRGDFYAVKTYLNEKTDFILIPETCTNELVLAMAHFAPKSRPQTSTSYPKNARTDDCRRSLKT